MSDYIMRTYPFFPKEKDKPKKIKKFDIFIRTDDEWSAAVVDEIVKCHECKYMDENNECHNMVENSTIPTYPFGYCWKGKKKDE